MNALPNILIFMTDQQRGDSILPGSAYKAITPYLDKIRSEAVSFTHAYGPSPHCSPARATFFTGLYPSQHGVWNNVEVGNALSRGLHSDVRLWSEDLKEAGYDLSFHGKWHVSSQEYPEDRGWADSNKYRNRKTFHLDKPNTHEWKGYLHRFTDRKLDDGNIRNEGEILRPGYGTYRHYGVTENPFNDRQVVNRALQAIRDRKTGDKPWCQYVGTLGPHDPYFVPQRFLDMYDLEDIKLPSSFDDAMEDKPAMYRRVREQFDQLTEKEHREAIRHYLAFCTYEDALFGELIEALEERDELDNTIVIYVSDHGDYAGEHGLWCKGLPCFNSAYHVPLVIRWPKGIANPGREVDAFVSLADIAPTLLEAAGLEIHTPLAGESLMPWLRDEQPPHWRDAVYTQSNGNELYGIQRSVMTSEWKYIYNGFDYDELYDLRKDPQQVNNLINDPQYEKVVREMCRLLWQFAYEHDDVAINSYIMVSLSPYGPGIAFADE